MPIALWACSNRTVRVMTCSGWKCPGATRATQSGTSHHSMLLPPTYVSCRMLPSSASGRITPRRETPSGDSEPDRVLDLGEMSGAFAFDISGVRRDVEQGSLVALAMRAVVHPPNRKGRLRKGCERGAIDIRSKPALDQRCQTKIAAMRKTFAGLLEGKTVSVRITQRVRDTRSWRQPARVRYINSCPA